MLVINGLLARKVESAPGTPASSTTKTGRHDIAEILLNNPNPNLFPNPINFFLLCNVYS
jgi:hypothetical protein